MSLERVGLLINVVLPGPVPLIVVTHWPGHLDSR